jgi:tetratricopeptide (TPR) repeat protein
MYICWPDGRSSFRRADLLMKNLFLLVLSAAIVFAVSCSRSGDADNASANSTDTGSYSNITDANQALQIGSDLLENNQTEQAIDALLRATELNPELAEAWFKLGVAYALIEKEQELESRNDTNATDSSGKPAKPNSEKAFHKAIEAYKKILDQNQEDDVSWYNLGRAYNKVNEDQEAAKALKQAVKLKPDNAEYQIELGAIMIKLAQYQEAIPPLKKALELDPENSRAADLLEDAQAGRSRVGYSQPKSNGNSNPNANANANANVSATSNASSNSSPKPTPTGKSTPKPETGRATPKPVE